MEINVKKVVNAAGRMTILGVSTPSKSVLEAMNYGAVNYVITKELLQEASAMIASFTNSVGACICANASSGLIMSLASIVCKDNQQMVENYIDYMADKNYNIVMLKGHNINYGVPIDLMIKMSGFNIKEAGHSNLVSASQVSYLIDENTKALLYVKSHHTVSKNMLSLEEMVAVAKQYQLPLIVDAAAEEDLSIYLEKKADYVIYSGTKAICGPTSGLVLTNNLDNALNIQLQYQGIGRAMKVGKETIYGLVQAVYEYINNPSKPIVNREQLEIFVEQVNKVEGISASIVDEEASRSILRVALDIDKDKYGCHAKELTSRLKENEIAIYTRDYLALQNRLVVDSRPLLEGDLKIILEALINIQKGLK